MNPMKTAPALLAALALASTLAACSGGGTASTGGTGSNPALSDAFDWSRGSHGPAKEIAFEFPDGLVEIAPEIDDLAMVPVRATARELDSAKYCAVDVEYSYPQGIDALFKGPLTEDELRFTAAGGYWNEVPEDVTTYEEFRQATTEQRIEEQVGYGVDPTRAAEYVAEQIAEEEEWIEVAVQRGIDEWEAWEALDDGQRVLNEYARPVAELDGTETGVFYSEDTKTVTFVQGCTSDASEPDGSTLEVLTVDSKSGYKGMGALFLNSEFASAKIAVMKNGDLLLSDAEVRGYETDSNGDWIAG